MNIGWAMEKLKAGKGVYREIWVNTEIYLILVIDPDMSSTPKVFVQQQDHGLALWYPNPNDLLAEDWDEFMLG